jgi:hypothetical protein
LDKELLTWIYKELKKPLPQNQWSNEEMDKWTKQKFFKRSTNGQKTHEEMLNIPGIKEMQIITTLRFHMTPVRISTKNTNNNKCW